MPSAIPEHVLAGAASWQSWIFTSFDAEGAYTMPFGESAVPALVPQMLPTMIG
jgi:hypothetical protein